jgi:sRNA-binding protein
LGRPQVSFAKRQREQAKRERQQLKAERRAQRKTEGGVGPEDDIYPDEPVPELDKATDDDSAS